MPDTPIRFEEFELDIDGCELRRAGRPLPLERLPMELLILLLKNPGKLVRRQAIERSLWGEDTFVEAGHSINTAINKLRATLRDDSRDPRFIRTVIGQGYKFIAEVKIERPLPADHGIPKPPLTIMPPPAVPLDAPEANQAEPHLHLVPSEVVPVDQASVNPPVLEPNKFSSIWFIAGGLVCLAILLSALVAIYLFRTSQKVWRASTPPNAFRSIAVLPFRDLAQNTSQGYLADGMTDQLITDLATSTQLRVISHKSVMQYQDAQLSLPEIARALKVDTIIEGSYLRQDGEIRITAQLLDARNDQHLWAETYRESDTNVLAMQDQVTSDIARQVAIAVGSSFTNPKAHNVSEEASKDYLRGRYLWNERTAAGLTRSIQYYTDAIRADRNYAEAYAALSQSYLALSTYSRQDPNDALLKAQFAAERALDLEPNLSSAHTALAGVKIERDWDWKGAEQEYRRAIAINPSDSIAHHWYGLHLIRMGRSQEGLAELNHALSIDPLSLIIATDLAESYYLLRRYDDAMTRVNDVLTLNPNFAQAHLVKAKVLEQLGRYTEAQSEYELSERLFGRSSQRKIEQAHLFALAGKRAEAIRMVHELEQPSADQLITGVHIAAIYCALHQRDDAMQWFDRAYRSHDTGMDMIGVEPLFDNCRPDARFQALLLQLKLKPQ